MINHLNIIIKDFFPIMTKLYEEVATTKDCSCLDLPPFWNFELWIKTPKGTWDKSDTIAQLSQVWGEVNKTEGEECIHKKATPTSCPEYNLCLGPRWGSP